MILQRVTILSEQDQLLAYETIRDYLAAGGRSALADPQLDERGEALRIVRAVMEHRRLDDPHKLEVTHFNAAPEKVREGWKSGRVIRAWGTWRFAREALAGAKPRPTARQRALKSKAGVPGLQTDDYLAGLREWVATNPPKLVFRDYDEWVKEKNAALEADVLPFARYRQIRYGLGLSWKSVVSIARGEITLAEGTKKGVKKRVSVSRGPHDLVSSQDIVVMTGRSHGVVQAWMHLDSFPVPALVIGDRRFWIRGDVELFVQGKKNPARKHNELAGLYVTVAGAAEILGSAPSNTSRISGMPAPVALVGAQRLWLTSDIEAFRERRQTRGIRTRSTRR